MITREMNSNSTTRPKVAGTTKAKQIQIQMFRALVVRHRDSGAARAAQGTLSDVYTQYPATRAVCAN